MRVWPGSAYPLGANWDGEGVNFAIFSQHATAVELCIFDAAHDATEHVRIELSWRTHHVWHAYLPDARPGQLYGYRVFGPYEPAAGHRFNPAKLCLDPYAKALTHGPSFHPSLLGFATPRDDSAADGHNSAGVLPKCIVVEEAFTWEGDRPPAIPASQSVIYECHVKGLTALHPEVPPEHRGTFLALASEAMLQHFKKLGVTAVELLPVQQAITEAGLQQLGLTNYWGYNTVCFFAPDCRFSRHAAGTQVQEFKSMVKALHREGIEVILDVVYNHSGEGDHLGPTVNLRGIDNASYYRLQKDGLHYEDFSGCGNTLNMEHPKTLQLVLDSLRYWVQQMHVDGFRFDLAPALAREGTSFCPTGRFLTALAQDPVLSRVKLIAEPWDLGPDGFVLGSFPAGWSEWNSRYCGTVRRFWHGERGQLADLAYRLAGSSDLFGAQDRRPAASINFVACHDGFTLADVSRFEHKHNEANGQNNRDGSDHNDSCNWGVEGDCAIPEVQARRQRQQKNFLATLALSQGIPMLRAGDELGQSQGGNNNAYCQDNALSWLHWDQGAPGRELLAFAVQALAVRRHNPVLRRRSFFRGQPVAPGQAKDLTWLRQDGVEMTEADWQDPESHFLAMLMNGHGADEVDERGRLVRGSTLLLLCNAFDQTCTFALPQDLHPGPWQELLNTAHTELQRDVMGQAVVAGHALVLLTPWVAPSTALP